MFEYAEPAPPETGGLLLELQVLREKCSDTLDEMRQQAEQAGVECETVLGDWYRVRRSFWND